MANKIKQSTWSDFIASIKSKARTTQQNELTYIIDQNIYSQLSPNGENAPAGQYFLVFTDNRNNVITQHNRAPGLYIIMNVNDNLDPENGQEMKLDFYYHNGLKSWTELASTTETKPVDTTNLFVSPAAVNSHANINNFTQPGNYGIQSGASNAPTSTAGSLLVLRYNDFQWPQQIFISTADENSGYGRMWYRGTMDKDGKSWSEWVELLNVHHEQTVAGKKIFTDGIQTNIIFGTNDKLQYSTNGVTKDLAFVEDLSKYLPLTGGVLTGKLTGVDLEMYSGIFDNQLKVGHGDGAKVLINTDVALRSDTVLDVKGNIKADYVYSTWLYTQNAADLGKTPTKIAVLDTSGWIYYRTPAEILADIGALSLAGGTITGPVTMNGQLKWTSSNALPSSSDIPFYLGIEAFADGGTTKWISKANVITSLGIPNKVDKAGDTMSGPLVINGVDGGGGGQPALLKAISTEVADANVQTWRGRLMVGAKDLTFLMGTYKGLAGLGAHKWTDAIAGSDAAWADFYLNPDGNKTVYIGGNAWTKDSGWFRVVNSGSSSGGKVQQNIGTIAAPEWVGLGGIKAISVTESTTTTGTPIGAITQITVKNITTGTTPGGSSATPWTSYLPLSGGTMTGPLTVNGGDGTGLRLPANNAYINLVSGATILGQWGNNVVVGYHSLPLRLRGNETRPKYTANNSTYKELALLEEVVTLTGTQTITGYKKFSSLGVDTLNGATLGNAILRQEPTTGNVIIGSFARQTVIVGNTKRPLYTPTDGSLTDFSRAKEIALLEDVQNSGGGGGTVSGDTFETTIKAPQIKLNDLTYDSNFVAPELGQEHYSRNSLPSYIDGHSGNGFGVIFKEELQKVLDIDGKTDVPIIAFSSASTDARINRGTDDWEITIDWGKHNEPYPKGGPVSIHFRVLQGQIKPGDIIQLCSRKFLRNTGQNYHSTRIRYKSLFQYEFTEEDIKDDHYFLPIGFNTATTGTSIDRIFRTDDCSKINIKYVRIARPVYDKDRNFLSYMHSNVIPVKLTFTTEYEDENDLVACNILKIFPY